MGIMPLGKYLNAVGVKVFLCLLCYCKTLPLSYMTDQRKILFIKKIHSCDNSVARAVSTFNMCTGKVKSKYSIHSLSFWVAQWCNG